MGRSLGFPTNIRDVQVPYDTSEILEPTYYTSLRESVLPPSLGSATKNETHQLPARIKYCVDTESRGNRENIFQVFYPKCQARINIFLPG